MTNIYIASACVGKIFGALPLPKTRKKKKQNSKTPENAGALTVRAIDFSCVFGIFVSSLRVE